LTFRLVLTTIAILASITPITLAECSSGRRILAADKGRILIVSADGKVEWEAPAPVTVHDLSLLPSGNVLFQTSYQRVVEITPDKRVVWEWVARPKPGYAGPVEIHAFQRLKDGRTMIAESGNARIIEVDSAGNITHEIPLVLEKPHFHRDTRLARKLDNGHYLVCHEGDGKVREYDGNGRVVWTYALELGGREAAGGHEGHGTAVYGAIRKRDGNTIIATGNGNRVIEVNRNGDTVWSVEQNELPGIRLAWVTTLQLLPNGNLVIGNCHAGPDNPQLIEVTRDKKVVWTLKNQDLFGNDLASAQVLDVKGSVIR
jgi:hypothetical protein